MVTRSDKVFSYYAVCWVIVYLIFSIYLEILTKIKTLSTVKAVLIVPVIVGTISLKISKTIFIDVY